jgi:hypothetical protein
VPVIKTVNIYRGPVTIINKRRGGYPYPGRVKNIYKGPVTIINPPPRNNGKPRGHKAGGTIDKPNNSNAVAPAVPINVRRGGASSALASEFGKSFSHRRAASSDVIHLSRKKLSLIALRQDASVVSQAVPFTSPLLRKTKMRTGVEPAAQPHKVPTTASVLSTRHRRSDAAVDAQVRQRSVSTPQGTTEDTQKKQRFHNERTKAIRAERNSAEGERLKQENGEQERATRQERKEDRRDAQQQAEDQRRERREEGEISERQERQEQGRREREEREERVQQARQEREEQQRREREVKQAREQERSEQERQGKEHKRQEEQERERRRVEQQNQSQPSPTDNDAGPSRRGGKRKDRQIE